jgi:hypothetical protein
LKYVIVAVILLVLTIFAASATPATAQPGAADQNLYLRRVTFDPLHIAQAPAFADVDSLSRLRLMQFASLPTAATRARLAAAGYHPLLYIPTNALLVRVDAHPQALAALPELRWSGSFPAAYKLPPGLDAALSGQLVGDLDLRVIVTPDADLTVLAGALEAMGGGIKHRADGLNGTVLRVRLPATALQAVLNRDDVIWAEPVFIPTLANDRARAILGVTVAERQLGWLTGAGQIIAVTDTGLDIQQTVEANNNPDFRSNRIAAAFGPAQMSGDCAGLQNAANWSDHNGHGTHVAGSALGGGQAGLSPAILGMAPGARLVVQAVSTGGNTLDCLNSTDNGFLSKAYAAGARIQNGSWGQPTGSGSSDQSGGYTAFEQIVDEFLWNHKQHLFVTVAGNSGMDRTSPVGVIDPDSIDSPGTAKNVLTVGASENDRPPTSTVCGSFGGSSKQENQCYGILYGAAPITGDFVSDHPEGLAAFSGRGPADDGRIKPEIVAPGTNIVSTASHATGVFYPFGHYNIDYAYDSGTSMSAPLVSGLAALTRQWLAEARQLTTPSAALIKALLLNGARDLSPGQYGTGPQREIPQSWPNNAEGWGRAAITDTIGLSGNQTIWLADDATGLAQAGSVMYSLNVSAGAPLRISLAWTDYPASPIAGRTLVNDLDLEVQPPNGPLLRGNASAELADSCRDSISGADRCDNVESLEIAAPEAGAYIVRVRGAMVPQGPQPFALAARAREIGDAALGVPTLQPIAGSGPLLALSWGAIPGATFYQVEQSESSDFATFTPLSPIASAHLNRLAGLGTYWFRVRACTAAGCGIASNAQSVTVTSSPRRLYFPLVAN